MTFDDVEKASLAASELMQGIEDYLRKSGVENVGPAPSAVGFDLFNPGTYKRLLAEIFYADQLDRAKKQMPNILSLAHKVLPEDGVRFANEIYSLASNALSLKEKGFCDEAIVEALFP